MTSYSVLWRPDGAAGVAAGSLRLEGDQVLLEGLRGGEPASTLIPYGELRGVRVGRLEHERVNGGRSLVLERTNGPDVCVEPLGPGVLAELAHVLAPRIAG